MHKVIVTIKSDNKVEVKVEGHSGHTCTDITKALERALGETESDTKTEEYYKATITQTQQQKLS